MDQPSSISRFRQVLPQVIATSGNILQFLSLGMLTGFSTVLIPVLTDKNNRSLPHFTMEEASWYVSLMYIFQPIGSFVSGLTLQTLGCRKLTIFLNVPMLVCWLMAYYSSSNAVMYGASALVGFVLGLIEGPGLRYVVEISHPSVRGILTASTILSASLGFLFIMFLGSIFHWRHVALISALIPFICTIILFMIPETPLWLMSTGRPEAALKSLQWLRGWTSEEMVREEYEKIKFYAKGKTCKIHHCYEKEVDMREENCAVKNGIGEYNSNNLAAVTKNGKAVISIRENDHAKKDWTAKLRDFFRTEMLVALTKSCTLLAIFSFAGMPPLRTYLTNIFEEIDLPLDPNWSTVWVALIGILGNISCMVLIKKVKKKPLLVFSSITSALCLILLALFFMGLLPIARSSSFYRWCPFALFIALFFFYNVGLHPVSWQYMGEILPYRGRGPATSIAVSFFYLVAFVGIKMFPTLREELKLSGVLLIYAVVCLGGIFFTYFLPETEGKFLSDIETENANGKSSYEVTNNTQSSTLHRTQA